VFTRSALTCGFPAGELIDGALRLGALKRVCRCKFWRLVLWVTLIQGFEFTYAVCMGERVRVILGSASRWPLESEGG